MSAVVYSPSVQGLVSGYGEVFGRALQHAIAAHRASGAPESLHEAAGVLVRVSTYPDGSLVVRAGDEPSAVLRDHAGP